MKKLLFLVLGVFVIFFAVKGVKMTYNNYLQKDKLERIAILGAMDEEIELLLKDIKDKTEKEIHGQKFYLGNLYGKDVVITRSGIGMVASSITTTMVIDNFNIKYLVFSGVAGALNKNLNITDIVISNDLVEYAFDATAFGYKKGQIPRLKEYIFKADNELVDNAKNIKGNKYDIKFGRIVSADKFVYNKKEKETIGTEFNALAVDMESAAFAQTCYQLNKKFLVIRSISDSLTDDSVMEYQEFVKKAVVNNRDVLQQLLEKN